MGDARLLRFLKLVLRQSFVEETAVKVNGCQKNLFRFGPLGALLRKNIFKQWCDAVVLKQSYTMYVEMPPLTPSVDGAVTSTIAENQHSLQGISLRSSLSKDCAASYLSALQLNNGQLPVCLASRGQCFHLAPSAENIPAESTKLLSNGLCEEHLLLQHYTPPVSVNQTFDYLLRKRLSWWKRFTVNPSKFSCSTSSSQTSTSEEANGQAVIQYTFPWGTETVETVSNLGDAPMPDMENDSEDSYKGKYHQKIFHPHLLECQTSVERCMSVFLTDGYREHEMKKKGDTSNAQDICMVLHLHPQLSPFKVAMSITGSRSREVRVLSEQVGKELRESGLSVLSLPGNTLSMDAQYKRNDELGVPYTVVLSDQTLDTGVVVVRSRDTRLKQQQHISKLVAMLSQNVEADPAS